MTATTNELEDLSRDRTLTERIFGQREFGVVLAVLALAIIGSFVRADVFLTIGNLVGVLRNAAVVTIIGYGMAMLITAGEFDLSVGSMMGLGGALLVVMRTEGFSMPFILFVVITFAIIYGVTQGLLVTKLGLPSLIVTIGTLTLMNGATLIVLDNVTQAVPNEQYTPLLTVLGGTLRLPFDVLLPFSDTVLFTIPDVHYALPFIHDSTQTFHTIPLQVFWMLALGAIFHYLLFYTRFGYRTMATGGNERSARFTGISTDQIKIANFAIVAVLAVFAGMSQIAFTGNASPTTGSGLELVVIASVVIGGTDLFGGEGTMLGTVLGALVFSLTQNILVLAGMGTQLFSVLTGAFIIFAVGIEGVTRHTGPGTFEEKFVQPLKQLVSDPRLFFQQVRGEGHGITPALAFATLTAVAWSIPLLVVVVLTFVGTVLFGSAIIPIEFSLFIVSSGVGALGTVPVLAFVLTGFLGFLSLVFVHGLARSLGGTGDLTTSIQVVGYALAPLAFLFVPFILAGLGFILPVVALAVLPVFLGIGVLLYVGVGELHDLDRTRSLAVVAGTALGLILISVIVMAEMAVAG